MTPLAISLGLRPLDTAEAARVPTRACVDDVLQQGALPPGHVYVGLGNHNHRLPTTKWKSPWQVGVNCTPPRLGSLLRPVHQGDTLVRAGRARGGSARL